MRLLALLIAARAAAAAADAPLAAARVAAGAKRDVIAAYASAVTAAPSSLGLALPEADDDDDAVGAALGGLGAALDAVLADALAAFDARCDAAASRGEGGQAVAVERRSLEDFPGSP